MVDLEYQNAYSEVLQILKYVPDEDVDKIPKDMLEMFEDNSNKDFTFDYDPEKTLQEQNVSKTARYIIAIIYRDYWATKEQREKIIEKEKHDLRVIEEQKKEKYSIDNIFKNNSSEDLHDNAKDESNLQALVEYKKPTLWSRIKEVFRKILGK